MIRYVFGNDAEGWGPCVVIERVVDSLFEGEEAVLHVMT
jgi:hypothetical protein